MKDLLKFSLIFFLSFLIFEGPAYSLEDEFFETRVSKVLSGTRVILKGGTVVEYAGIEAPSPRYVQGEMKSIAKKAVELNTAFVKGKVIRVEPIEPGYVVDSSKVPIQAYVYSSGQLVNGALLKHGLAKVRSDYGKNEKYFKYFNRLQTEAAASKKGIWKLLYNALAPPPEQETGNSRAFK